MRGYLAAGALALLWAGVARAQSIMSACASGENVALGDDVTICLGIGPTNYTEGINYKRGAYEVGLDEFSRMEVRNSWDPRPNDDLINTYGDDVAIHVQAGSKRSFQKLYRSTLSDGRNVTFPYMTIIVIMDKGKVDNLVWDDGCHFCSSGSCTQATYSFNGLIGDNGDTSDFNDDCYLLDSECVSGSAVSEACTLTVRAGADIVK
mmetsp:Transcript_40377/g.126359  ORF Transcript_40377/g.126359 Transcript_40377/m.126359 type:complete len:206 (-) Transcript_40377:525-1142(-)